MNEPVINKNFPFFRAAAIVFLAILGRIIKYVIPLLAWFMIVLAVFVSSLLIVGVAKSTAEYGAPESIARALLAAVISWLIAKGSRWLGEQIIQFNERLTRSTAELAGWDLDRY